MSPPITYTLRSGYLPGCIGRIAELHGSYYHAHWHFGLYFEAKVATELSAFLRRYDEMRDGLWCAVKNGRIEGAVVIDGIHAATEGAHLRWFIVSEALRGKGAGRQLLEAAIAYCRQKKYARVFLWTFEGLDAARHLYESLGFRLIHQQNGTQWGTTVTEQRFELDAPGFKRRLFPRQSGA
ncbi:MAG: GNAT family N-acetyltransferase [Desulfobacterales bacterium]|nr:GNAT family N-acetyltransferase [Desulfobacterales bacterium]MDJ0854752.1 GNAT family N-acetyltransferase [Desulfobacterales bacterium]MDJ0886713.1 GNAT family N-acetyltransferase [Desulfobacterales bacterium]